MADVNLRSNGGFSLADVAAATLQPAPTDEAVPTDEERTDDIDELALDDSAEDLAEDGIEADVEDSDEDIYDDEDDLEEGIDFFRLTVEGEEVEATLDELKTSYQLRAAAQKRLNEATTIRAAAEEEGRRAGMDAAQAEITQTREAMNSANTALQTVLQAVGQEMFTPRVQPPDPALRETDPIRYHNQRDDYAAEVERIRGLEATVGKYMANASTQQAQRAQQMRLEQGRLLRNEREDLRTQEGQQLFTAHVRAAQNAVGFTQEEVDAYPDRRGLLVLEMAGKYLESVGAIQQDSPQSKVVRKAKKTMRPGANRPSQQTRRQKQRRADRDRAAQTGDYRDVAKLLVQ